MGYDTTDLEQLVSSLGTGRSALDELNHLQELLERAEALKARLVARARQDGHSWQKIANNIGGTKQAAQQRYSAKASAPVQLDPAQITVDEALADQLEDETTTELDASASSSTHYAPELDPKLWKQTEHITNWNARNAEHARLIAAAKLEQEKPQRVAVIPCSGAKKNERTAARDLYTGQLYRSALLAAEAMQARGEVDRVLILSAKHGLTELDEVIDPYDTSWTSAGHVHSLELIRQVHSLGSVELTALLPKDYTHQLEVAAAACPGVAGSIVKPLSGLSGIGQQRGKLRQIREGA